MNSFAELPVSQGQILAEKYRLDYVLGERGSGMVVAAEHLALQMHVAIKVLRTSATAEAVERFFREARAAASIASDHVVRVLDLDRLETGEPYIVMELLEGRTLAARIEQQGPLSVPEAVDYLLHACEAIGKAHAAGIVHRELKPANLFLTTDEGGAPTVKVLDFGICKLAAGTGGPAGWLTGASALLGSPAHMAPEQWASATNVGVGTDIWALGAILYELLAGRPAFVGSDLAAICNAVQHHEPAPLISIRADVPGGLHEVIARCLAKSPAARPPSAALLGLALAPWCTPTGGAVLEELEKLSATGSQLARVASAATGVVSVQDPRMVAGLVSAPPAERLDLPALGAAPTFAVHGVTVNDPSMAIGEAGADVAPPTRTASGTIQLAAMADPLAAMAAPQNRPLPATVGMQASVGPGLPPTVRMPSIPPAPTAPPVAPPGASWPSSAPPPAPMAFPSAPTPANLGAGGAPAAYAPVPPGAPRPSLVAPTVVGPHLPDGRAPFPWVWLGIVIVIVVAAIAGGLLVLLG